MILTEDDAPILAETLVGWRQAKKIKSIRAKFINDVADKSIIPKLRLQTLEGLENMKVGAVVCIGEAGDVWQQEASKLFKKYNVVNFDPEGWLICEPKPENVVEFVQWQSPINTHSEEHYVRAQWGEEFRTYGLCQRFSEGDYIVRNPQDRSDVWVVRKKLFENTYSVLG